MKGFQPMTSTERVRKLRDERQEAGWKQINVWLSPTARKSLRALLKKSQARGRRTTMSEIINDAISRLV
jgi:hypothetical protein